MLIYKEMRGRGRFVAVAKGAYIYMFRFSRRSLKRVVSLYGLESSVNNYGVGSQQPSCEKYDIIPGC